MHREKRRPVTLGGRVGNQPVERRRHHRRLDHLLACIPGFERHHAGIGDPAGHQHIDGDAGAGEILGHDRRKGLERRFRRPVGRRAIADHRAEARRHVDDAAPALAHHVVDQRPRQRHRRVVVDRDEELPLVRRHLPELDRVLPVVGADRRLADPGIVDEDVDLAEAPAGVSATISVDGVVRGEIGLDQSADSRPAAAPAPPSRARPALRPYGRPPPPWSPRRAGPAPIPGQCRRPRRSRSLPVPSHSWFPPTSTVASPAAPGPENTRRIKQALLSAPWGRLKLALPSRRLVRIERRSSISARSNGRNSAALTTRSQCRQRRLWVGLSRPGEARQTTAVFTIGAVRAHRSKPPGGWLPALGTRGFQRPLSDPSTDL